MEAAETVEKFESFMEQIKELQNYIYSYGQEFEEMLVKITRAVQSRLLGIDIPLKGDMDISDCVGLTDVEEVYYNAFYNLNDCLSICDSYMVMGYYSETPSEVTEQSVRDTLYEEWEEVAAFIDRDELSRIDGCADIDLDSDITLTEEQLSAVARYIFKKYKESYKDIVITVRNELAKKGISPEFAEDIIDTAWLYDLDNYCLWAVCITLPQDSEIPPDMKDCCRDYKGVRQFLLSHTDCDEGETLWYTSTVFKVAAYGRAAGMQFMEAAKEGAKEC